MMKTILPLLLAIVGVAGGAGAGFFLRPAASPPAAGEEAQEGETAAAKDDHGDKDDHGGAATPGDATYLKLDQQFVVPVLEDGRVSSMVALSLTLDIDESQATAAIQRQPLMRDRFLRVLMDHANSGGFDGTFTSNGALGKLKTALVDAGNAAVGGGIKDVLILDVARQDV